MTSTATEDRWRRFILPYMHSNMYIFIEGHAAILVDPHASKQAEKLLLDAGVQEILILLTHEHFDHASGVPFWQACFPWGCVVAHACCAQSLAIAKNNRPLALLKMITPQNREDIMQFYRSFPVQEIHVDKTWRKYEVIHWHGHKVAWEEAPGHSPGSGLIFVDDSVVFTGDSLIPDVPVILRYPGASVRDYDVETLPKLLRLPNDIYILPGHGDGCRMAELRYQDGCFCRIEEDS